MPHAGYVKTCKGIGKFINHRASSRTIGWEFIPGKHFWSPLMLLSESNFKAKNLGTLTSDTTNGFR